MLPTRRPRQPGFTLIEVMVALLIMAVLATMAWQGVDAISRARQGSQEALERTQRLNTVIAQWERDLQQVHDTGAAPALAFDGASLRLTRDAADGVQLVVWSLRGGSLVRWASPTTTRVAELQEMWLRSQQLLGNESGQLRALDNISALQVFFYQGNGWANAQSSGDLASADAAGANGKPAAARELLPAGVRLVLGVGDKTLTRDVMLGPQQP